MNYLLSSERNCSNLLLLSLYLFDNLVECLMLELDPVFVFLLHMFVESHSLSIEFLLKLFCLFNGSFRLFFGSFSSDLAIFDFSSHLHDNSLLALGILSFLLF